MGRSARGVRGLTTPILRHAVIRKGLWAMGSISGTFALAAFIAGLFCTRLKTALIAGAVPAFLYAALVVVGLWDILRDVDVPYFLGIMTASILAILLPAVIASYLRRGIGALVHRRQGSEPG